MHNATQVQMLEEKLKKLGMELECQRHNADAARLALDQKMKEREREARAELAQTTTMLKEAEKRLVDASNAHIQETRKVILLRCRSLISFVFVDYIM